MAQYDVHRNANPRSRDRYPYLLDVQADMLRHSSRRLIVPLVPKGSFPAELILHPGFVVENRAVILSTLELFSIPREELGPVVASLAVERERILRAIDFVLTGA